VSGSEAPQESRPDGDDKSNDEVEKDKGDGRVTQSGNKPGSPSGGGSGKSGYPSSGLIGGTKPSVAATSDAAKDPATARNRAAKALDRAEKAVEAGDFGRAFQESVAAWQNTMPFSEDAECKLLAAKAEQKMKELAEAANASARDQTGPFKPLSVK